MIVLFGPTPMLHIYNTTNFPSGEEDVKSEEGIGKTTLDVTIENTPQNKHKAIQIKQSRMKRHGGNNVNYCALSDPDLCTQDAQYDPRKGFIKNCNTQTECVLNTSPKWLGNCGAYSDYIQVQYDCLPGNLLF